MKVGPILGFLACGEVWNGREFVVEDYIKLWADVTCTKIEDKGHISGMIGRTAKVNSAA